RRPRFPDPTLQAGLGHRSTTDSHCFCARYDPLGTTSVDRTSAVDRIHAGIAKGIPRAGASAWFCYVYLCQGGLDKAAVGSQRTRCRNDGHAGLRLPVVFRRPRSEEPDAEPVAGGNTAAATDF